MRSWSSKILTMSPLMALPFFQQIHGQEASKLSFINPKLVAPILSISSFLHLQTTCPIIFFWICSSLNTGKILERFTNESFKLSGWLIPSLRKKRLWYYFDNNQLTYLHLDGSPTHRNPWSTWIYYDPFPSFHSFRNLPQSRKLPKISSKSSPPKQQPRPHNPLEQKHLLLRWNVRTHSK